MRMDAIEGSQNPLVDTDNSSKATEKDDEEKVAEKEKVELKIEFDTQGKITEARDTSGTVKGKQIIDDPDFFQGPINLVSLSPIQMVQLASFAHAKAGEDLLKSHTEDNELVNLTSGVLEKLMPTFQKNTFDTPSGKLKNLINSMDTHFESLEKSVEVKVHNEFNAKRLRTLKRMIADDRASLDTCVKSMQDGLSEGDNIYKSCLSLSKFTKDIEKKSKEHEEQLAKISQSLDPLSTSMNSKEDQLISLLDKIKSLSHEKNESSIELENWGVTLLPSWTLC